MKLAYIIPSLRKVGPVVVVLNLVNELIKKNKNIVVYYLDESGTVIFPCEVRKLNLSNFRELYGYDVIHSHMLRPDAILSFLPFYKGKKITTIHNIVETDILYTHGKVVSYVMSKVWVLLWQRFSTCVVLSNVAKRYYLGLGLSENRLKVVYNGVSPSSDDNLSPEDQTTILKIKKMGKILGTACLFNRRKGLDQVIKALPNLPGFQFVIVGDGPERDSLENLTEELGVSKRVHFFGFKTDPKPFFNYFDIYVMPSREEGFGLALSEALLYEIPAVCSDIPIFREVFSSKEVTFFEIDNISSLSNAIKFSDQNRDALSKFGSEKVKKYYLQSNMLEKYLYVYLD